MVEETVEKQQLPEAPISITVMAYYAGFQVLITRRTEEQPIISQVPGIATLVNKLVEAGFMPIRELTQTALPTREAKDKGSEIITPICQTHDVPKVWREGINKDNRHYAPWACPQKNLMDRFANIALGDSRSSTSAFAVKGSQCFALAEALPT